MEVDGGMESGAEIWEHKTRIHSSSDYSLAQLLLPEKTLQVEQRCNFDKDCMKQDKYKLAYAESKARDQCDAGVDHCDPLVVEGYQGGKTMPATLFGSEFGSDEHGEGSTVVLYIGGVGRVQLRNTGCALASSNHGSAPAGSVGGDTIVEDCFEIRILCS